MNVADFAIRHLKEIGVDTVFMVTGGQAMFLNDAVFKTKGIKPVFHHHEQAASMAAEAYGRVSGKMGVVMVTAGPGAINALNGVVGAWVDSAPMLIISGQSHLHNVCYMQKNKIRQHGLQGINIKPLAEHVTKYFVTVDDPTKILYYLEKAIHIAHKQRTGPVWVEIPIDIQRTEIPEKLLTHFEIPKETNLDSISERSIHVVVDAINSAKRPLLLVGQGVILAGARKDFSSFIDKIPIPVVTTRLGLDLIESENDLFVGRPGLYGDRPANFAIQNADLIIAVGARLDLGIVGYNAGDWGRYAKKIVVDIDREELNKPGIERDIVVLGDAREFFEKMNENSKKIAANTKDWIRVCTTWKKKYPMVLAKYKKEKPVNSYYFIERLSRLAKNTDTILVDTSSIFHVACQTWKVKVGQRFITTGGISTMGYWPAAIGVSRAKGNGQVIAICGDGSFQFNIQELSTISQNKLPIKLFVLNNNGYLLIRHTQKTHLGGRLMGESPKTGLWCPDIMKIAKTYKIKGVKIASVSELDRKIKQVLAYLGPVICEVMSPQWQQIIPRISSEKQPDGSFISKPYEDLFPFLNSREFDANMIAKKQKKEIRN